MEIYEEEIVYYAFVNKIPIQSIDCPHSNESIRTEIRQILVDIEKKHPGIKLKTMRSINKILDNTENISEKQLQKCEICNFPSSGKICSVCKTVNLVSSWKDQKKRRLPNYRLLTKIENAYILSEVNTNNVSNG